MKYIKTLLFALVFAPVMSFCQIAAGDGSEIHTREQVESIVDKKVHQTVKRMVKDSLEQWVNFDLVNDKIEKVADEKLDRLQAGHDAAISHHITLVGTKFTILVSVLGVFFAILAAIIGILIPLLMNRRGEQRLREIEKRVKEAENSARQAKYSLLEFQARDEKDFKKQIKLATQFIQSSTGNEELANAYYLRGTIYGSKSYYKEAIEDLHESINLNISINKDSENSYAYYNLGDYYRNLKQYKEAINDYNKALKYINHAYSYKRLADIYAMDDYDDHNFNMALKYATQAIEVNENECGLYLTRSNVNLKLKKYAEALNDAEQGLELAKKQERRDFVVEFNEKIKEIEGYSGVYAQG